MDYQDLEVTDLEVMSPGPSETDEKKGLNVRAALREIAETVVLTLIIFLAVRGVIQNFKVEGSSMEPNLHSGQYLLVNKAVYFNANLQWIRERLPAVHNVVPANRSSFFVFGQPQRGDVVVFRYPKDPSRDFIKRVIGVPGDTVEVRDGRVFVNAQQLIEPYIDDGHRSGYSYPAYVVAPGEYFVLGDNRNNSSDSHVWGPVPQDNIIGKAWIVYWPVEAWGLAPNYAIAARDR